MVEIGCLMAVIVFFMIYTLIAGWQQSGDSELDANENRRQGGRK